MPFDGLLGTRACGPFDAALAPRATIDFEARSPVSVTDVGAWKYTEHPGTQLLCMVYRLPYWEPGRTEVWHPAFPDYGISATRAPLELFEWIATGGLVEAHNAEFERAAWFNICQPKYSWPEVPLIQWRCSAAKAAAFSLPRSLEDVARVLRCVHQKDMEGNKVMKRLMKPRKLLKREIKELLAQGYTEEEIAGQVHYHFSVAEFQTTIEYCRKDVLAEEEVSWHLRDLTPKELEVFHLDALLNQRGTYCDMPAVDAALYLIDKITSSMTAELPDLTDRTVSKASQRAKLKAWINEQGVPLLDTQGTTVDRLLDTQLPPKVRRVLEICREVNRSSTSKYMAMKDRACLDSFLRGMMMYHGASTGRWTGVGVQPHNFPRGTIKDELGMETAWEAILTGDPAFIEFLYGENSVMELLSHAVRGAFTAPPGYELAVADFAAIEARVVFWLANQENALSVLRAGEDIYCDLASRIFKRKITKKDAQERQLGKQAILGLGFGMGANKFIETCAKYNIHITPAFAEEVVNTYRTLYRRVRDMWYAQEAAAIKAVQTGQTIQCGKIFWRVVGRFLHCKLPSGRMLAYCDPVILMEPPPWGGEDRPKLTFMAIDSYTRQWTRQDTYGGTLVENMVQAIARDILAEAMLRAEHRGYMNAFSVHDELVTYIRKPVTDEIAGTGGFIANRKQRVKAFEKLVTEPPDWAPDCPIGAEGWIGHRYRKG